MVVEAVKEAMAEDRENAVVVVVAVAVEEATVNFLSMDKYSMTPSLEYFCLCFVYTNFGFLEAP